jgi:hypothetical protein
LAEINIVFWYGSLGEFREWTKDAEAMNYSRGILAHLTDAFVIVM